MSDRKTNMSTNLSDLLGRAKVNSDITRHRHKIRYQEATSISSSQRHFYLDLPVIRERQIDMSSLRLKFKLTQAGGTIAATPGSVRIDARTAAIVFQTIKFHVGSREVSSIEKVGQIMHLERLLDNPDQEDIIKHERELEGDVGLVAREDQMRASTDPATATEFVIPLGPKNTVLNSNSLLPLWKLRRARIEFYLADADKVFYDVSGGVTSYALHDVELWADYIESASLSNYFDNNPVRYSIDTYAHRYDTFANNATKENIRLPSTFSSLHSTLTVLRPQYQQDTQTTTEKHSTFKSGAEITEIQVMENSVLKFEEPLRSHTEYWRQLVAAYPNAKNSHWLDTLYKTTKNLVCISYEAAPNFQGIASGINTSNHNAALSVIVSNVSGGTGTSDSDTWMRADAVLVNTPDGDLIMHV